MCGVLGNPETLLVAQQKTRLVESAVRDRIDGDVGAMPLEAAIARLAEEVDTKKIRQTSQLATAPVAAPTGGDEQNEY